MSTLQGGKFDYPFAFMVGVRKALNQHRADNPFKDPDHTLLRYTMLARACSLALRKILE